MPQYNFSLNYRDGDGDPSSVRLSMIKADEATAITEVNSIAGAIDALTGVGLESITMSQDVDISALGVQKVADESSDVEVGGRFMFNVEGVSRPVRITLPGFNKNAHTLTGSNQIDPADPAVVSFTDAILNNDYKSYLGFDLVSVRKMYETFGGKA